MTLDSQKPHVLIVGAGLAGLSLAQCLRKQGVSFEIFDGDKDLVSRHGYAIGVHSNSVSLGYATFTTVYRSLAVPEIGNLRCVSMAEKDKQLVSRLHFGKKLRSVKEEAKGVTVHFEDGTSASGDMLVGADGVNSKVERYLPSIQRTLRYKLI
ncbi:hypothetical protein RRF57_012787 [Xylaria bambusicola]|uniref:FAD-binding domain-containing protein n=1 Tax=Xylaria bambusicola TaxID=326684 RepID=A0AAN7UQJ2_9PEZI